MTDHRLWTWGGDDEPPFEPGPRVMLSIDGIDVLMIDEQWSRCAIRLDLGDGGEHTFALERRTP